TGRPPPPPLRPRAPLPARFCDWGASARQAVIAQLRGRLLDKQPNRIIVDVNGVGYDVFVPLSTFYSLGEPGADVVVRVHTHVREDALMLYGFATRLEQDLFERLISI